MNVTLDHVALALRIINVILVPALGWLIVELRSIRKCQAEMKEQIKTLDSRVVRNEEKLNAKPDGKALTELKTTLAKLEASMSGLADGITRVERVSDRLNQFLLERKG